MKNFQDLIEYLRHMPNETQWLEFKHNNYTPEMIGKDISALANGAALCSKDCAYMLWGVHDESHEIVGTNYDLQSLKQGNQELENWLRSLLSSHADFEFHSVPMNDVTVGVLIIYRAANQPIAFQKMDYIRVGSYTKKLADYPALQGQLWGRLRDMKFEEHFAKQDLDLTEAISLLEYPAYFELKKIPQPTAMEGICHYLEQEEILVKQDDGLYAITNMGAMLFAKKLSDFPSIARKAVRVVQYQDANRYHMLREHVSTKGYAAGFESLLEFIDALLPTKEVIEGALRTTQSAYPRIAIRETVANALIHQDFSITGAGPLVEIFDGRIEITNPGAPMVDIWRIVDNPPRSRNEKLAELMRRLRICEELGTGWDKIVLSCELAQLPPPRIDVYDENMKVTLYAKMPFSDIPPKDKLWACYLHACIKYVEGQQLTNSSLRARFGLPESAAGNVSRLIKEAGRMKLIKPLDPTTAPRYMKYIPIWA